MNSSCFEIIFPISTNLTPWLKFQNGWGRDSAITSTKREPYKPCIQRKQWFKIISRPSRITFNFETNTTMRSHVSLIDYFLLWLLKIDINFTTEGLLEASLMKQTFSIATVRTHTSEEEPYLALINHVSVITCFPSLRAACQAQVIEKGLVIDL